MTKKKNKGLLFIILSPIVFVGNSLALLTATFVLDSAPSILFIVAGTMILASIIGFLYGMSLRNRTN